MHIAAKASQDRDYLTYLKQLGVRHLIIGGDKRPGDELINPLALRELTSTYRDAGFEILAVENVPRRAFDEIILGGPGRDAQIDRLNAFIRNLGEARIPYFGYHWMVNPTLIGRNSTRTSLATRARGGAVADSFQLDLVHDIPNFRDRAYDEEELWGHYAYFLKAVLPVAEAADVKLSLHPPDPPIPSLGGIPRMFTTHEAYERAMAIADSRNWGLTFCLGNWGLMGQETVERAIDTFGRRNAICYLHFQGVRGVPSNFTECFFEEADLDFVRIFQKLKDVGFGGGILPAHVPHLAGDDTWGGIRGFTYGVGYLRSLLVAVGADG